MESIRSDSSDPWSRLGLRALVGRSVTSVFWVLFPVCAGVALGRYGPGLGVDALFFLGLFLLLFEGIVVYDLVLRNPILKMAAAVPVHENVVRKAYRQQWFLVLSAVTCAIFLSVVSVREHNARTLSPVFHVGVPLLVGLPIFAATICKFLSQIGRARSETKLGKALGQEMLPSDLSPMIYALALTFGAIGSWLLLVHFASRVWQETGAVWPLAILVALGAMAAGGSAIWSDKFGPPAIVARCTRLIFLDRQGLLLASKHQKTSPIFSRGAAPVPISTLVRIQTLRRAPLFPVILLFVGGLAILRGAAFGWASVAAGVAFGLCLDFPARWIQDRLVTPDLMLMLGAGRNKFVGALSAYAELRMLSLKLQVLLTGILIFLGIALGHPPLNMLAVGAVAWTAAAACGFFLARRVGASWPVLRALLMVAAISCAWFPTEAML